MARRRYQEGSVYLNRGRYYGRWREDHKDQHGLTHRVQCHRLLGVKGEADCPSEKIARRRLDLILARINATDYRPGRQATVDFFADLWKREVVAHLKPSTIRSITYNLKCHILPLMGTRRLDEISALEQQWLVTALAGRSLSSKSIRNVLGTLGSMLNRAKKWGYLTGTVNMRDLVIPDTKPRRRQRSFTADEVRSVLLRLREPFQTMLAVVAVTGLRAGEVLGLRVEDVDLNRRLLWVRQSAWQGRLQTVKTKSSQAALPLPERLATRLEQFMQSAPAERSNPLGLLFCNTRGKPYNHNQLLRDELQPALKALGLYEDRCGFHAFRHAHSSLLVDLGASPAEASAQLRHSDPRITLGIYTHVVGQGQRKAVERLADTILTPTLCQQVLLHNVPPPAPPGERPQ